MNFTEFHSALSGYQPDKIIFVGLGNESRGDDATGLLFIDELKKTEEFGDSVFIRAGINPENYLLKILEYKPELVVFIDTAYWGGTPGEIMWFSSEDIEEIGISTHAFSITIIEQFLLKQHQTDFKYLGIQPYSTEFGKKISPLVLNSIKNFFSEAVKAG